MRVLASYNIKGGVGKTATAVNLAYLSARAGARTLVWDLDPQGAATYYFRVQLKVRKRAAKAFGGKATVVELVRGADYEGLDLIPAGTALRRLDLILARAESPGRRLAALMAPLAEFYDHVYLDCPPGLTLTAEALFDTADALLVPTIPTVLSLRTLEQLRDFLAERDGEDGASRDKPLVLPFFSMVDMRKRLHRETVSEARDGAGSVLASRIPYSSAVERTGIARAPLPAVAPRHPVTRDYVALWREVHGAFGSLGRAGA